VIEHLPQLVWRDGGPEWRLVFSHDCARYSASFDRVLWSASRYSCCRRNHWDGCVLFRCGATSWTGAMLKRDMVVSSSLYSRERQVKGEAVT